MKKTFTFFLLFSVIAQTSARPEYLNDAIEYGAKNCGYCHDNPSGGHGQNERGQWLLERRIKLGVDTVEVDWLNERESIVKKQRIETPKRTSTPKVLPAVSSQPEPKRPFDYTANHGEWPTYAGNLQAQKYSPLDLSGYLARIELSNQVSEERRCWPIAFLKRITGK